MVRIAEPFLELGFLCTSLPLPVVSGEFLQQRWNILRHASLGFNRCGDSKVWTASSFERRSYRHALCEERMGCTFRALTLHDLDAGMNLFIGQRQAELAS